MQRPPCVRNRLLRMYLRRQRRAWKRDPDPACPICLGDFEATEFPLILACDHVLHHECYAAWHQEKTAWLRADAPAAATMTLDAFGVPCPLCRCAAPLAYLCDRVHRGQLHADFVQKRKAVRML